MGSEKAARLRITRGKAALLALCFLGFVLYGMYYNGFGANAEAAMAYFGIDEAQNGAILTVQSFGCLAVAVLLGLFGERLNKMCPGLRHPAAGPCRGLHRAHPGAGADGGWLCGHAWLLSRGGRGLHLHRPLD